MDNKEGLVAALQIVKTSVDVTLCATSSATDLTRYIVSLSLAEAETVRKLLHQNAAWVGKTGMALRDLEGTVLDRTAALPVAHDDAVEIALQCLRFFNCEMYYKPAELDLLMRGLDKCDVDSRLAFFSECLRLRRRERNLWTDTPLAKVFTLKEDWHLLKARAKIQEVKTAIRDKTKRQRLNARKVFLRFDSDGDACLSYDELQRALQAMQLGFAPRDISEIVRLADRGNAGKISLDEFTETFDVPIIDEAEEAARAKARVRPTCSLVARFSRAYCFASLASILTP
jgi:hypothetical protein